MMKAKLLLLLFCFCTVCAMGQGVVTRNKCKTCGKVLSKCVCNKKKPTPKPKPMPKPTPKPQPAPEAAGYDVTFACNVSSANLYVDGNANGTASGSHFLKTGQHTIQVTANGYKDYTRVITVNRQNCSFYIELEKKPVTNSYSNHVLRVGNVVYNMKRVEGGTFTMGATSEMSEPYSDEKPTHQVTLSSYSIGETEVTQALWQAVMGSNPSLFKGDNLPVERVSWDDCQTFISKLNNLTGQRFRLPTEAEWEFAARGGKWSNQTQYSGSSRIDEVAWYKDNSGRKTHPVKTKKANELGLYDMTGNVLEWCQDKYGKYTSELQSNPEGPSSGSFRVLRGGCWGSVPRGCRSSGRGGITPGFRNYALGLRLALSE